MPWPLWLVGLLLLLGTIVALWFGRSSTVQSASIEPWPSFMMVYRDWAGNRGPNNSPGFVVVRLTYKNSRDWQTEILEDSVAPDMAGTRGGFSGNTASGFNNRFKQSSSEQYPADALLAPADWLIPGRIARFRQVPGAAVSATASRDIMELVYKEQVPCFRDLSNCDAPLQ